VTATTTEDDIRHMRAALALARRGLGRVWPNPAVGCVLVKDGNVIGRGWTQPGGRPHAETEALRRAGKAAKGATAYVTLEPCAHHGETPPCADALIEAGIARCFIAVEDPDPRVDGGGVRKLEGAGIEVRRGLCKDEAETLNAGFLSRLRKQRPFVTLKAATTIDGRIATRSRDSQWITGPGARQVGHLMRATHDAILVGANTAMLDDPTLTCRVPGLLDRSPVRIVIDGRMRLPLTHNLVRGATGLPTWLFAFSPASPDRHERRKVYQDCGIKVFDVAADENGHPDPADVSRQLAEQGITRLLIEGGGIVAAAFLSLGLIDELVWFRGPSVIGGDGLPAIAAFGVDILKDTPVARRISVETMGVDLIERYSLAR
jgi:diaminohydroxyphosphoribosylaminopyrimidine deaminase/5-amino-6-(5-phosphoribosylamino)uracil reductase